jgi:hypothetical protein
MFWYTPYHRIKSVSILDQVYLDIEHGIQPRVLVCPSRKQNPLILVSGIGPPKPLNVITERATSVAPVNLGVKDRPKFEMFASVNDFDGARQRLFAAWKRVRKVRFKCRNVENRVNA